MASPLDQVVYNQDAGYLPINLVAGDDLSMQIALPFDITLYTFSGYVQDSFNAPIVPFTIVKTQSTPTGIITATLTGANTLTIPTNATYYIQWTVAGAVRTFLAGPIVAVPK